MGKIANAAPFATAAAIAVLAGAGLWTGGAQTNAAAPRTLASVRILFGLTDTAPSQWDGTVRLDSGSVTAIQGVRFGPEDSTDYSSSWKAATRAQGQSDNVLENGVIITAQAQPDARWNIHTARGDFSFTLRDVFWGDRRSFLDGAVEVERVPPTTQLTPSDDDEDFPAVAASGDDIWVSYVRFFHSDRARESFQQIHDAPASFDYLARPAGGDQVFALHSSRASGKWSPAEAVSPKGENTAGTALAVDGQGRTWVVWSAGRAGNFDLYARAYRKGQWGAEVRITKDAGADLKPVAATDAHGRVWIAWQGFRNGNLDILAAVQQNDGFLPEQRVSTSSASDWEPAIAAAPNGDVAVSWDTYEKGDYDVFFRKLRLNPATGIVAMDTPVAAAATQAFEANSSVAFDAHNRLWIAYETSTFRWGKNYGAADTSGTPLYEARNVRVKCFDGNDAYTTSADLLNVLPGTPISAPHSQPPRPSRQSLAPNPNQAKNRRPGTAVNPRNGELNSMPKLAVDAAGGVYLAFRSLARLPALRSPLGAIWYEHIAYFDGHKWAGPVFVPRTDGLLDAGTALVGLDAGHLLAISAMDHRLSVPQAPGVGPAAADLINSDLYAADLRLDGLEAASNPELVRIAPDAAGPPDARVRAEADQIRTVRDYRIDAEGARLRILRGDMQRQTDHSTDGTRDGTLSDAYRYMIDVAGLDWGGCCDTENGDGHEYSWWREQTVADEYLLGARFTPMFAFEHVVRYPEGRRVALFARRGVRPVPHLPPVAVDSPPAPAPDTQMFYRYLKAFGGISVPTTTATDLGTDWRDSDAEAEPDVEIYQGFRQSYESADGPRAARTGDAINGLKPAGYVTAALDKGIRLGFLASSGRISTHLAYANVLAADTSRQAILDGLKKRHVYASTDNIVADVRCGDHIMGDEFSLTGQPEFAVKLIGSAPFARVVIVKDGSEAYSVSPNAREVNFVWTDAAPGGEKVSYYYLRGEQTDGQLVWASPMWIHRVTAAR